MSKNRRNFTARFKADLVLEVLKGEKELNEIAAENNIQPNLLRNWKKEFEENAAAVFDNRKDGWMEKKLKEEKKAKEEYAKKVGQLTMQIDWLEKKSAEFLGPDYESQFGPKPFDDCYEVTLCQGLISP